MTIYRLLHTGEMPGVLIGHTYRVREICLEQYLEHGLTGPETIHSGGGLSGEDTV